MTCWALAVALVPDVRCMRGEVDALGYLAALVGANSDRGLVLREMTLCTSIPASGNFGGQIHDGRVVVDDCASHDR